jgi:hypothetical protein
VLASLPHFVAYKKAPNQPTKKGHAVDELQIEYVDTKSINPYAKNPKFHADEQIAEIAASIKEFGFTNPILIRDDGTIIAGHGRFKAAQRLGLKTVPAIRLDHLSDAQARALLIVDNKLAENSGWNAELLSLELSQLKVDGIDMDLLGFRDSLNEWISAAGSPPDTTKLSTGDVTNPYSDPNRSQPETDEEMIRGDTERIIMILSSDEFEEASEIITKMKEKTELANVTEIFMNLLREWDENN